MIKNCYSFCSYFGTFSPQITWPTAGSACLVVAGDPGGGVGQVDNLSQIGFYSHAEAKRRGWGPPENVQVLCLDAWHVLQYFKILDDEKLSTLSVRGNNVQLCACV